MQSRRTLLPAITFLCALVVALGASAQTDKPNRAILTQFIDHSLENLKQITGLAPKKPIISDLIAKEDVSRFLAARVKESTKPEQIRAEEITLKLLGFVPPDYNLEASTVELLTEQAAAFYDYKKKRLFLLDSVPIEMQETVLVHELAHALADQHFNLDKYLKNVDESDDTALARLAVMEGQATWLMAEAMAAVSGESLKRDDWLVERMANITSGGGSPYPVFQRAPLYMRETLVFPYTRGLRFQHAVVKKLGQQGFREVFEHPPVSTQQIMHPEKYFSRIEPSKVALPDVERKGFKLLADGTLGELDHSILLKQYTTEADAEQVAPEWSGGRYRVLENKKSGETMLLYASLWSSPAAARQFLELYGKVLAGKWARFEVAFQSAERIEGRGDTGLFRCEINQKLLQCVEGLETPKTPSATGLSEDKVILGSR